MSGDILAAIEGALDDWETSPDAMRWTPDPPPTQPTSVLGPRIASRAVTFRVHVDLSPFITAVTEAARAMAALMAGLHIDPLSGVARPVDTHHPRPLPIDGAAYHRRRRARTRRTR
ncbi:hypothetical protein INN71_02655 [Nocardioides sp. ChNu-153]|uniref:hypothetical protein n=1 Tax=unclassified Nocardioides TaxID=2615069 RepID=UPI002406B68D|nr:MULTISPECIES: hypothetical protein [unclassified Nocardioides]MDF9718070.1 hypothetical protein [Nocardioides sp. ChNu-99]MDN7120286.1 hypothetical protein [Nocardioides sp. ChNu-153]